jgi:tRNA (cmo5U34)-methyltransferase
MIAKANEKVVAHPDLRDSFTAEDAFITDLQPADTIACYYTVQFVRPFVRQALVDRLYNSLNWGGALLIFEKVRGADARFQDILTTLYKDYKFRRGYTPEEIVSKTRSLKGVLEPFSTQGNINMFKLAGFIDVNTVQKYLGLEGFLAIK